ncbi:DUF2846 domain-containing protein [Oleiphilus messinensis]|nr:DUF2846 domain-containing protein [Oleiphilus messinensis]
MNKKWIGFILIPLVLSLTGCPVHQSIGKSVGAFLHPVTGTEFVHISNNEWSPGKHALIYFYRPNTQWAADEIESPSVYVDQAHYFNIRANSFTWLEVYPGERHIIMRRPLLGLEGISLEGVLEFDLDHIVDVKLEVEAGKIYYLRYSEVSPPETPHPDLDPESPLVNGDLQLVTRQVAMQDIVDTRFLKPDLIAPNHAATSIVKENREYDFILRRKQLEEARKVELADLKDAGHWRAAAWYWPFGGGPTKRLESDMALEALEKEKEEYYHQLEIEEAKNSSSWWPF